MSVPVKLKTILFGFTKQSVLEYINDISKNIDDKLFLKDNEIKKLKKQLEDQNEEISKLNKQVSDFQEEKGKISQMYIRAEETAANIIEEAESKSEKLISETEEQVKSEREKLEREQEEKRQALEEELELQKAIIDGYKAEVRCLKDRIKLTLSNFDSILSDTIDK